MCVYTYIHIHRCIMTIYIYIYIYIHIHTYTHDRSYVNQQGKRSLGVDFQYEYIQSYPTHQMPLEGFGTPRYQSRFRKAVGKFRWC